MISSRKQLQEFLRADSQNYKIRVSGPLNRFKNNLFSSPISEQKHIWSYIKYMRYVEFYMCKKEGNRLYLLPYFYYLSRLRKESHITGFQIPPNTCGKGLTIWHWGTIIVNGRTRIGNNCTLYPGVLIGHKIPGGECAHIGDNVFIGSGTKIIGSVKIGNNVRIGQNCVIVKDIAENSVVVCSSDKIVKNLNLKM